MHYLYYRYGLATISTFKKQENLSDRSQGFVRVFSPSWVDKNVYIRSDSFNFNGKCIKCLLTRNKREFYYVGKTEIDIINKMIIIGNVGKKNTSNNTYFYTSQVRVTLTKGNTIGDIP